MLAACLLSGRPRLADKLKLPKLERVEPLVLHVKKPLVGEYVDRPRRSTRKRKVMEFFDDDEDDESEKEKSRKEKKEKSNTKLNKVKESLIDNKQPAAVCSTVKRPKGRPSKKVKETEKTVQVDTPAKGREPQASVPSLPHTDNTAVDVKPEHRVVTDDESVASVCDDDEDDDLSFDSEDEMNPDIDDEKLMEASKHIFSCTYCDFAATDLTELRGHYNENHPNDILACQPCNQYFLSLKVSLSVIETVVSN